MAKSKNSQKKVRVFITPACPYCFTLKEFLKQYKIKYQEVDVSQDMKAREEMIKKSNQLTVPVMEIDGQIVVGFDQPKIKQLLKIS